jgi:HEAT repeat protein
VEQELLVVWKNGDDKRDIHITGALAAIGNGEARDALLRAAREEKGPSRSVAIGMLGYVADEAAMRLLKEYAASESPELRIPAEQAIKRFRESQKSQPPE